MTETPGHEAALRAGARVWYPDGDKKWLAGVIESEFAGVCVVKLDNGVSVPAVPATSLLPANPPTLESLSDLCQLTFLNPPGVLHNLGTRLQNGNIYTFAGRVLIAVNPCKQVPLYTEEIAAMYAGGQKKPGYAQFGPTAALENLEPHIYLVAATAFRGMVRENCTQSLLVSGESGAGKTETTKKAMQYFAQLAGGGGVENKVLETNPILEAFGNAKTTRNPNSSRFGKLLQIYFTHTHQIAGAAMKTYLLEKPRVISQLSGERNYHIFYQLLAGVEGEERERLHLTGMDASGFNYLNKSGCSTVEGMDDRAEFQDVLNAMSMVGMDASVQQQIMSVLAGILWLGNLEFRVHEDRGDTVSVQITPALHHASELLGFPQDGLIKALITVTIRSVTEEAIHQNSLEEAITSRDALAKVMYNSLFTWVVEQINTKLAAGNRAQGPEINILDIFGFEEFKVNSFEQLCINYTNERLQQQFNTHLFDLQRAEYVEEGLDDVEIVYDNNKECVDVIERFPPKGLGVLSILDSQCRGPCPTDEGFLLDLRRNVSSKFLTYNLRRRYDFTISHYAGSVSYNMNDFVKKNKDTISQDLVELLGTTRHPLLQQLAPLVAAEAGDARKGKMTVGMRFSAQLQELTKMLDNTALHFIRCIKPSATLTPGEFDSELVMQQLRSSGVMEVVRLAKAGYPTRYDCAKFTQQYSVLLPGLEKQREGETSRDAVIRLLAAFGIDPVQFLIGHTKVFFKVGVVGRIEDEWSRKCRLASVIQASIRSWHLKTWYRNQQRAAVFIQSAARGLAARKQFTLRKEFQASAIKIQRAWRRYRLRRAFRKTMQQIVVIQMCVRRMLFHRRVRARVHEREKRQLVQQLEEEENRRQQADFEFVRKRLNVTIEEVMLAVEAYVGARDAGGNGAAAAAALAGGARGGANRKPAGGERGGEDADDDAGDGALVAPTGFATAFSNPFYEQAQATLEELKPAELGPAGKLARLQLQNILLQHQIQLQPATSMRTKYQQPDHHLSFLTAQVQQLQEYILSLQDNASLAQQLPPAPPLLDLLDIKHPPSAAPTRAPLPRPVSGASPGLPLTPTSGSGAPSTGFAGLSSGVAALAAGLKAAHASGRAALTGLKAVHASGRAALSGSLSGNFQAAPSSEVAAGAEESAVAGGAAAVVEEFAAAGEAAAGGAAARRAAAGRAAAGEAEFVAAGGAAAGLRRVAAPGAPAAPGTPPRPAGAPLRLRRVEDALTVKEAPPAWPEGDAALSEDIAWQHVHQLQADFDRVRGVLEDGVKFISEVVADPDLATENFKPLEALNILMGQFKVWSAEFNEQLTKTRVVLLAGRSKVARIKQGFEQRVQQEKMKALQSPTVMRQSAHI